MRILETYKVLYFLLKYVFPDFPIYNKFLEGNSFSVAQSWGKQRKRPHKLCRSVFVYFTIVDIFVSFGFFVVSQDCFSPVLCCACLRLLSTVRIWNQKVLIYSHKHFNLF